MRLLKMGMMTSTAELERRALSAIWHWGSVCEFAIRNVNLLVLMKSEGQVQAHGIMHLHIYAFS